MTLAELDRLALKVKDLNIEEQRLIALVRNIGHGNLKIFIRKGLPYRVEEGISSFMLSDE
jgi:hypothetical protein